MANASTTQASSASQTRGTPISFAYGYNWVTGKRDAYWQLQNTGNSHMDYHRVGKWLLGDGEWDGCSEIWIGDVLVWTGDQTTDPPSGSGFSGQQWVECLDNKNQPMVFNFHSGCDSTIGAGLSPSSSGPDQGVDVLHAQLPSAIQPLCHSRIAYYMLMRKQPILNQSNTHQNDPSQWGDINPVGLWRGMKCRLFDGAGAMTGYAFTTNLAWEIVDLLLRRKLFRDYALSMTGGPAPLPEAVSTRFNWEAIYESAQYYDAFLANGRRRFTGNFLFSEATSLQACLSKMLLTCRSFLSEDAGKIVLRCDKPRPVSFTFSREHILPGSWNATDRNLDTAPNQLTAQYRELLVPAIPGHIVSITAANQGNPEVTMSEPHCLNQGDRIAMGGTGTIYDGTWSVGSVPDATNVGTPEEVDPVTFKMVRKGANYPTSVGEGGVVGLLYSRFNNRYPQFWHKNNMLARGAVGLGIARVREKVAETIDLSITTYDQASRITRYERDRRLGLDQSPYVTPPAIRFRTSLFAKDASGRLAASLRPGDRVTLNPTASWTYQGDYEVLEPQTFYLSATQTSAEGDSIVQSPAADAHEIEFNFGPYSETYMYDTSDDVQAGWPVVPGSDPGNDGVFTSVDLANGGNFVFFTGQLASGSQFQLPSTGYPSGNMLAWAGPAGANVNYRSAHFIKLCSVDSSRNLTLQYSDNDIVWGGDVNYAAVCWLSSDVTTTDSLGITWIEFTLLGGEKVIFGQGVVADGTTVELPSGYAASQAFAVAYPHDQVDAGHIMFLVGAYVDSEMVVHLDTSDNTGHVWHGNASALVFAWQNNMGTVTTQNLNSETWMAVTLPNGKIFSVGCGKSLADGATFGVPSTAGDGSTLEVIPGSSDGSYESGAYHAQGVGACYLDTSDVVHITFNDGSGHSWTGQADVLAAFCVAGSDLSVIITVTPSSPSIGQSATVQFAASISGTANKSVTWSVDGVAAGNSTIGTINATGIYTAPLSAGVHTITAALVADTSVSGSATVTVTGAQSGVQFSIDSSASLEIFTGVQTVRVTGSGGSTA